MTTTSDVPVKAKATQQKSDAGAKKFAPMWLQWGATIFAICVVLLIGVSLFWGLARMKTAPPREEPKPTILRVEAFQIEAVPLKRFIASFGTARADIEVTVSAEVSGRVTEKNGLEVGNVVRGPEIRTLANGQSSRKQGEVLVQIDPQTYRERVTQAESLLEQDRVNLSRIEKQEALNQRLLTQQRERLETITAEYERTLDLYNRQAENESIVRQKKLELEQYREALIRLENDEELLPIQREELKAQRATHQSDLKLSQLELDKATVRAPTTGALSGVFVEQGQYVRAGDPIVQITSTDRVEIPVAVTLEDAVRLGRLIEQGKIPVAQLARHEADFESSQSKTWNGYIERIDPVADAETRTVRAFVEVENAEQNQPLRPGTFTYARIEAGVIETDQGVLIPREALLDGTVFVVSENDRQGEGDNEKLSLAKPRQVTIAETYQAFALISQGLHENEQIVTTNLDIVANNSLLDVRRIRSLDDELSRVKIPYLQRLSPKVQE